MRRFRFPEFPAFPEFPRFPRFPRTPSQNNEKIVIDLSDLAKLLAELVDERVAEIEREKAKKEKTEKLPPVPKVIQIPQEEEDEEAEEDVEPPKSKYDAGLEYDLAEPKHEPSSIFENLESIFGPITANKAFHDALNHPVEKKPPKDPFVFIANRLTFLIKTKHPIIWDTSAIDTINNKFMFISFDKNRNPRLDMKMASKIAGAVNYDYEIQDEVEKFLEDTKWKQIYCAPHTMEIDGEKRDGFVFALIPKEEND